MSIKAVYYNMTLGLWITQEDLPLMLARGWAPFPLQHKGEIVVSPAGFVQLNPDTTLFLDHVFTADYQSYRSRVPRKRSGG